MKIKGIVFDLDGTLVDSLWDVTNALNAAMQDHYLPTLTHHDVLTYFGNGIRELIVPLLKNNGHLYDSVLARFKEHYHQGLTQESKLFEGIFELLEELAKKNIVMGVLTNKQEAPSIQILKELGVLSYFLKVAGPDTYGIFKPNGGGLSLLLNDLKLLPQETLMIGDSSNDILAAQSAGVHSVGVTYGYADAQSLEPLKPTHIVADVDTLKTLLNTLC